MTEPIWRTQTGSHDVHRSDPIVVGVRHAGGQLHGVLQQHPGGQVTATVTASHLTGLTVDLRPADALQFAEQLAKLLMYAG